MKINKSKWKKHLLLKENSRVVNHLPETEVFTKVNFSKFLDKYKEIIVKPSRGSRGKNIYKVTCLGDLQYEIHHKDHKTIFTGKSDAYTYLKQKMNRRYLLQQYVDLARVEGCPTDNRVVTQKDSLGVWAVTGKVTKVAGEGFIVTNNRYSGGRVMTVSAALKKTHLADKINEIKKTIDKVVLEASKTLSEYYGVEQKIFGFDIGIDHNGHVWIIEANLHPMLDHFDKLKNKKMLRRIQSFHNEA
ncbi:YheC/YheD family protein [Bacillus sp. FJAT-27251]|uniref:YheC/YheD family protein n=1 Tax=Bacillus sp. FJAT-27251 TaxID=1684142 RepID=UPI0006A7A465|nr:YheC/YheD family protein [Bacillus sp. FJAT-27251]